MRPSSASTGELLPECLALARVQPLLETHSRLHEIVQAAHKLVRAMLLSHEVDAEPRRVERRRGVTFAEQMLVLVVRRRLHEKDAVDARSKRAPEPALVCAVGREEDQSRLTTAGAKFEGLRLILIGIWRVGDDHVERGQAFRC